MNKSWGLFEDLKNINLKPQLFFKKSLPVHFMVINHVIKYTDIFLKVSLETSTLEIIVSSSRMLTLNH